MPHLATRHTFMQKVLFFSFHIPRNNHNSRRNYGSLGFKNHCAMASCPHSCPWRRQMSLEWTHGAQMRRQQRSREWGNWGRGLRRRGRQHKRDFGDKKAGIKDPSAAATALYQCSSLMMVLSSLSLSLSLLAIRPLFSFCTLALARFRDYFNDGWSVNLQSCS